MTAVKLTKSRDVSQTVITSVGYVVIISFTLFCFLPFLVMVMSSFASEASIIKYGFTIFPKEFSLLAYTTIFSNTNTLIGSYIVTIALTAVGTVIGLFLTAMTGYALQRQDFKYASKILLYIYFTTLFSGGLIPYFLLITKWFQWKDNYMAILVPSLLSQWNIIMMKNLMKSIPHSITESAKIDGANDFRIFVRLILPMSTPALATIGFYIALGYWNEWYNAMLFLSPGVRYKPLQFFLYNILATSDYIKNSTAAANVAIIETPTETMKLAVAVVATGPIIFFFPFIQKYFIKGITIGAVKG